MREVGRAIDLLDVARRAGVGGGDVAAAVEGEAAVAASAAARARRFELGEDRCAVEAAGRALPPFDLDRLGACAAHASRVRPTTASAAVEPA